MAPGMRFGPRLRRTLPSFLLSQAPLGTVQGLGYLIVIGVVVSVLPSLPYSAPEVLPARGP